MGHEREVVSKRSAEVQTTIDKEDGKKTGRGGIRMCSIAAAHWTLLWSILPRQPFENEALFFARQQN